MEAETLSTGYFNDPLNGPYPEQMSKRFFPVLRALAPAARAERLLQIWAELPPPRSAPPLCAIFSVRPK